MAFKVKKIEFDCSKVSKEVSECLATGFVEIAEVLNYVPTIKIFDGWPEVIEIEYTVNLGNMVILII